MNYRMGFHLLAIMILQLFDYSKIPFDLSIPGNRKLQWQTVLISLNSICEKLHLDNDLRD